MDHNKEEANRARETAKKRFLANDFPGARKFALKAQFLNPDLEGIAPMVATFDVHVSAQNVIHGEVDYYGILGVNPEADDESVRKRYRKLAVMLHPDRNKSVGAEEAFKFLSQAWGVFSDKGKRAEYDLRRNLGLVEGGRGGASTSRHAENGVQRVSKAAKVKSSSSKRVAKASASATPAPATAATSDGTFWTVCRTCRTQYEYHRVYLNQNLLCPNCRKPFIAVETDPPGSGSIRKTFHEHQFESTRQSTTDGGRKRSRDNNNGVYGGEYDSFEWSAVCTGTKNAGGSRKDEVVRREYTRRVAGAPSTNAPKRRKGTENTAVAGGSNVAATCFAPKSNSVKEFSDDELKNLLKKKAKPIIRRKLQELAETETDAKRRRMGTEDVNMANAGSSENKSAIGSCCLEDTSGTGKDLEPLEVNDPDFCDFNKERTEKSFSEHQIWACYDSLDGMPRGYVMIDKVISLDPFKMSIIQLTSETKNELRSTKWLGFGVRKACGNFRAGKTQICRSPYIFSHRVEQAKGNNHREFHIYPRRGDVWALYKNWSHDWNYLTGADAIEYDVVEVVEGYTEEYGVSVVPLMKVAGFRSVFHHHLDPKEIRRISRDEILRFSHRIPSYLLTGGEAPGAPRGCIQLDPAATPSQLLRVIDM